MRRTLGMVTTTAASILSILLFLLTLSPAVASAQPTVVSVQTPDLLSVKIVFSENIDPTTGNTVANYLIFEKDNTGNRPPISSAATSGSEVTLALTSPMTDGVVYSLRVQNVENTSGQVMTPAIKDFTASGPDLTPPEVTGASASDATTVVIDFSEPIDAGSAGDPGSYAVYPTAQPANVFTVTGINAGTSSVTLSLGSSLSDGVEYTVEVSDVEDLDGNVIAGNNTATFSYTASTGTPIADIQANPSSWEGQVVTVEGVVYIPSDYRGTTVSGFIQDESGRGINLFGTGMDVAALQTVGNRVRVTGTVAVYFSTTEISDPTEVTLLSSGNPLPAPMQLSTGAAASSDWEGTFIEVSGPIVSQAVGGPGVNYTVDDGSGPIVVRVVDPLGAPSFTNGTTITARGAGGAFQSDFQVLVGVASDVFEGSGGDTTPPVVTGANGASDTSVLVNFNEALDPGTAQTAGNYQVYESAAPSNTLTVSVAALTGSQVTLTLASAMTEGTSYTVAVSNVEDLHGNVIAGNNTATFSYTASTGTPIADIQANPSAWEGQVVTVEGVVYIPSDYRGTTVSGFIQDESGRGINLFGTGMDVAALQTVGNRVRVTGTVAVYFATTEITDPTEVTLLSSGNPRPAPMQLSTGAAASSDWEGTFIEVSGPIVSQAVGGPGVNYTVDDGSGPIVVRVVDPLGAPTFANGTTITARGAGGAFQSDFQVLVGQASDVFEGSGGDTTPPVVTGASGASETSIRVSFNEALDPATAQTAGNYQVYESSVPSNTLTVSAAALTGSQVTLTLASAMTEGTSYTVAVSNVEDLHGNVIAGNNTATFSYTVSSATPIADIQANPSAWEGQVVTVQGVVYIPSDYRGATTSGFIQDESGRGINLFGSGMNVAALQTVGNRVEVTGTVALFFATTEIANPSSVKLISSGTRIPPTQLSTGAAASSDWEGTFIEVSGPILSQAVAGGATNYTVDDGSGPIVVRVVDTLNAATFTNGTTITARGAGGAFQSDFQVLVGLASDIFEGQSGDLTPPRIDRASLESATSVIIDFSEAVEATSATTAGNYGVFRTNSTGDTAGVTSVAFVNGADNRIRLSLDRSLNLDEKWSVRVANVKDLNGNAIPASGVTAAIEALLKEAVDLEGPPFTFLPRDGERYPLTINLTSELIDHDAEVILRIFDMNGTLVKTLYDSRVAPLSSIFSDNRATIEWDGTDEFKEWVPAGAYVAHLQVRDTGGSGSNEVHIPVVVATRLDR